MDLVSKQTRLAFREHLVGWTLRQISDLFDAAGVPYTDVPDDQLPSGMRRSLVECYYAGIDWTSARDVQRVLAAYEQVLAELDPQSQDFRKLTNLLRRDGYVYEEGTLRGLAPVDIDAVVDASDIVDRVSLQAHIRRIQDSVDSDPALAIGSSKELVETVAKAVLREYGQDPESFDTFQRLVKGALKCLNLSSEDIPESKKGAKSIKQALAGLNQIVGAIAELRNLYGTGHGRLRQERSVGPRHARLVVGAAATLATFMLETLDTRIAAKKKS